MSSLETPVPVAALEYRDMSTWPTGDGTARSSSAREALNEPGTRRREGDLSEAELAARIARERADAARDVEQALRKEYEQKLIATRAPIVSALAGFEEQRDQYFGRVEAEVVQLALSIAAKILHREAQVDPMLVAALVRLAVEKMREGSNVTVRVGSGKGESWRRYFANIPSVSQVEVAEDAHLTDQDCMVETELGSANFGLDTQLKEVEQGFFDLLALRPVSR